MLSRRSCSVVVVFSFFLIVSLEYKTAGAKAEFLFDNKEEATSSYQQNYRLSNPKIKQPLNRVPLHLQDLQFGSDGNKDVIRIIDPPVITTTNRIPQHNYQYLRTEHQDTVSSFASANDENRIPNQVVHSYPLNYFPKQRPSVAFLMKPESANGNSILAQHQEAPSISYKPRKYYKQTTKIPLKFGHFSNGVNVVHPAESFNYNSAISQLQQFYPFQLSAAVRHKQIVRIRPHPVVPQAKERVHTKTLKTFQSKILHDSSDFEEEIDHARLSILENNRTKKSRIRRDTNSRKKTAKLMRGSLLPVALTIMGENGELLTGRALLQHITVLLKNTSAFEPKNEDEDLNKFTNGDVLLNEKDFHRIMKNSMNLTDPTMLTVLGMNALNDSSLLSNTYVNEYLNCIDASKIINRFQALQAKIDCMKRKLFDNSNFALAGSSRYSISDLPAALVYADVMSNIKKLVRPKNGIAFYSLPVDELTHLQQVVLPIEEYVSQIHNAHFAPRNYHNRKFYFNESPHPKMPIWYIVKPDGRIYQTEESRQHPAMIFNGFPDIPNADIIVDGVPRAPFFESVISDE